MTAKAALAVYDLPPVLFSPLSYYLLKPSFLLLYYGKMNLVCCLVAGFLNYSVNHCLVSLSLPRYLFFKISVSAGDLVGNKGMFVGGLIKNKKREEVAFVKHSLEWRALVQLCYCAILLGVM